MPSWVVTDTENAIFGQMSSGIKHIIQGSTFYIYPLPLGGDEWRDGMGEPWMGGENIRIFAHKMAIIAIYALYHMFFQEIQGNTIFGVSYI